MKKVKETNETKKLTRVFEAVRVLSGSELQSVAGGDGESGSKRPV
jgi:hypothetical protein